MTAIRAGVGDLPTGETAAVAVALPAVLPGTAVDDLCRRLHPRLVGALRLYLGDAELARELAQDTLVRVVERSAEVTAMERPDAWAFRVGFNLARSRLRRLGAERRAHARSGPSPTEARSVDIAGAVAVRRALALLPPRQRQAIVLRFYGDLPVDEVARAMGCRPGTVKAHLHQGIAALRLAGLADDADPATDQPSESQPSENEDLT